jgi:hypothetical protein
MNDSCIMKSYKNVKAKVGSRPDLYFLYPSTIVFYILWSVI